MEETLACGSPLSHQELVTQNTEATLTYEMRVFTLELLKLIVMHSIAVLMGNDGCSITLAYPTLISLYFRAFQTFREHTSCQRTSHTTHSRLTLVSFARSCNVLERNRLRRRIEAPMTSSKRA